MSCWEYKFISFQQDVYQPFRTYSTPSAWEQGYEPPLHFLYGPEQTNKKICNEFEHKAFLVCKYYTVSIRTLVMVPGMKSRDFSTAPDPPSFVKQYSPETPLVHGYTPPGADLPSWKTDRFWCCTEQTNKRNIQWQIKFNTKLFWFVTSVLCAYKHLWYSYQHILNLFFNTRQRWDWFFSHVGGEVIVYLIVHFHQCCLYSIKKEVTDILNFLNMKSSWSYNAPSSSKHMCVPFQLFVIKRKQWKHMYLLH